MRQSVLICELPRIRNFTTDRCAACACSTSLELEAGLDAPVASDQEIHEQAHRAWGASVGMLEHHTWFLIAIFCCNTACPTFYVLPIVLSHSMPAVSCPALPICLASALLNPIIASCCLAAGRPPPPYSYIRSTARHQVAVLHSSTCTWCIAPPTMYTHTSPAKGFTCGQCPVHFLQHLPNLTPHAASHSPSISVAARMGATSRRGMARCAASVAIQRPVQLHGYTSDGSMRWVVRMHEQRQGC